MPQLILYQVEILDHDEYPYLIRAPTHEDAAEFFMTQRAFYPFRRVSESDVQGEVGEENVRGTYRLYPEGDLRKKWNIRFQPVGVREIVPSNSPGEVEYEEPQSFWFREERP